MNYDCQRLRYFQISELSESLGCHLLDRFVFYGNSSIIWSDLQQRILYSNAAKAKLGCSKKWKRNVRIFTPENVSIDQPHMKMFSLDQIFVSLVARGKQRVSSIRASVGMTLLSVATSVRPPLVHLEFKSFFLFVFVLLSYLYFYYTHFCICFSDKSSNKRMNTISVRIAPLSLAASVWAPLVYLASFVPTFR